MTGGDLTQSPWPFAYLPAVGHPCKELHHAIESPECPRAYAWMGQQSGVSNTTARGGVPRSTHAQTSGRKIAAVSVTAGLRWAPDTGPATNMPVTVAREKGAKSRCVGVRQALLRRPHWHFAIPTKTANKNKRKGTNGEANHDCHLPQPDLRAGGHRGRHHKNDPLIVDIGGLCECTVVGSELVERSSQPHPPGNPTHRGENKGADDFGEAALKQRKRRADGLRLGRLG